MNMDSSKLTKRIEIIRIEKTRDPDGYETIKETVVRRPWAQFSQISGTELLKMGASFSEVKVRFLIRWSDTMLTRKMVVRYNGADYNIEYINGYGDSMEYVELWCSRVTLEG
jgi:SPP1 family predicted phage head-tail adaptor